MKLYIYGSGAFGREIRDMVEAMDAPSFKEILFFDDAYPNGGETPQGVRVLGGFEKLEGYARDTGQVTLGVGQPCLRQKMGERARGVGFKLATIIDPSAIVRPTAQLGEGVTVAAQAFVSCDTVLGCGVMVNIAAMVGHDVRIGDYSVIDPHANLLGHVQVGSCTEIGTGAVVRLGFKVGSRSIVGLGSAVLKDVPDGVTVLGSPARLMPHPKV